MCRIAFTAPALVLMLGLGFTANPVVAQQVTSQGTVHGQNWNMGQDLDSLDAMTRVASPRARDRAARAARQAQFNRPITGMPIRPISTRER